MTHIRGSDGAGQTGYRLTVRSTGTVACEFHNQPSLTLLGKSGKALPTHVHWTGKLKNITLDPETSVTARLRFSPDIPGPGEPQKGRCEPEAESVRVDFKNLGPIAHAPVHPGPVRPPTSVCEHGRITALSLR
jgi:hypothetical protein